MKPVFTGVSLIVILTIIFLSISWYLWSPDNTKAVFTKENGNNDTLGIDNSLTIEPGKIVAVNNKIYPEIKQFVVKEQLPLVRNIYVNWNDVENKVQFFSVIFLGPEKFLEGSASAHAIGLQYKNKIGWISVDIPDGFRRAGYSVNDTQLHYYELNESDSYLYSRELLTSLPYWRDAYLVFLSRDPDTPRDALLNIALILREHQRQGENSIALKLLENEKVQTDREILQVIANIEDPWYAEPSQRAMQLLEQLEKESIL